jgi:hypothetical protein
MEVIAMRRIQCIRKGGTFLVLLFTAAAIVTIATPVKANLLALWKFEEAAGDSNIIDFTTYHHDGKIHAGPNDPGSAFLSTKPYRINNVHGKIGNHGLEFGCPGQGVIPTSGGTNRNWNYAAVPDANDL